MDHTRGPGRPRSPMIARRNDEIVALRLGGMTVVEIAEQFGLTTAAIYAVLRDRGVRVYDRRAAAATRKAPAQKARDAKIVEMYAAGQSLAAIGAEVGLTRERVRQIAVKLADHKTLDEKSRAGKLDARVAAIWEAADAGAESFKDVARRTGVNFHSVMATVQKHEGRFVGLRRLLKQNFVTARLSRTEKTCTVCGVTKPIDEFYHAKDQTDRRSPRCAECSKAASAEWTATHGDYPITVDSKICPACRQTLAAEHFNRCRKNKSGLQTYCVDCANRLEAGESVATIAASYGIEYVRTRQTF